jgi:hypothetical protein
MRARSLLIGLALLAGLPASVQAQEDALETYDAVILRSFTILKCHASQDKADQVVMARVDAVKKAALDQLWAEFDRINPARHAENGKIASDTLEQRTEAHDRFIQSQVVEYGCDWLDGRVFPPEH